VSEAQPVEALARVAPLAVARMAGGKHVARDYSYVPSEIRRIVVVAGFLIVALIVTAVLRNQG